MSRPKCRGKSSEVLGPLGTLRFLFWPKDDSLDALVAVQLCQEASHRGKICTETNPGDTAAWQMSATVLSRFAWPVRTALQTAHGPASGQFRTAPRPPQAGSCATGAGGNGFSTGNLAEAHSPEDAPMKAQC